MRKSTSTFQLLKMNHIYQINLPHLVIRTMGEVGSNAANQLLELLAQHKLIERMKQRLSADLTQEPEQKCQGFVCDLRHGVFIATTQQEHEQLMKHIERLIKFGLLNMPAFWASESIVETQKEETEPKTSTAALALTPPAFMSADIRNEIIEGFKREIREKYTAGLPLTLPNALATYCSFRDRSPSKDEVSRINILTKAFNNPFLHELTREHFSDYENNHLKHLGIRTIEERIGLVKRIYETLLSKHTIRCANPLAHWKPSVCASNRKTRAAAGIATMERVCTVFGGPEFAKFGQANPAFYLVVMTAVVTGMRITSICRLRSSDLIKTLEGTLIIDLMADKTAAGKRQIPIPAELHTALKNFLKVNGPFPLKDRGKDKGCSDAISTLYEQFSNLNPGLDLKRLNPHGLRAALNTYLDKIGIQFDYRCALLGHKNNHVNNTCYTTGLSVESVANQILGKQTKLLSALNFDQHLLSTKHDISK